MVYNTLHLPSKKNMGNSRSSQEDAKRDVQSFTDVNKTEQLMARLVRFNVLNITPSTSSNSDLNDELITAIENHIQAISKLQKRKDSGVILKAEEEKQLDFHIKELSFARVVLSKLPVDHILKLKELGVLRVKELSAVYTLLTELPDFAWDDVFPELERFSMFGNYIAQFPDSLGKCSNLVFIDIRSNPCLFPDRPILPFLTDPSLCTIHSLKTLKLSATYDYTSATAASIDIPASLLTLHTNLSIIDLNLNKVRSFCSDLTQTVNMKNLTEISIMMNKLTELNPLVFCGNSLPVLKTLNIAANQLTKLPAEICTITTLEQIYASRNELTRLPDNIGSLESLRVAQFEHNNLEELPDSFSMLSGLVSLDLSDNKLASISDTIITGLISIESLYLGGNNLSNQTVSLSQMGRHMTKLYNLNLSFNQFSSIDEIFESEDVEKEQFCIYRISQFIISGNQLTTLPIQLAERPSITRLHAGFNSITALPDKFMSTLLENSIRYLSLVGNELTDADLPDKFFDTLIHENRVSALDLSHNRFDFKGVDVQALLSKLENSKLELQIQCNNSVSETESSIQNSVVNSDYPIFSGTAHMIGARPTMEDSFILNNQIDTGSSLHVQLYAIFDGHAGCNTSNFVAATFPSIISSTFTNSAAKYEMSEDKTGMERALIESALQEMDQRIKDKGFEDGCTAIVVLIINHSRCICANIGDSRIVLVENSDSGILAKRISVDHKPKSRKERLRIKNAGGVVHDNRVNGYGVSRSLGDHRERPFITAEPFVVSFDLDRAIHKFIVLGCDGVWDVLEDLRAAHFVSSFWDKTQSTASTPNIALSRCSAALREYAFSLRSLDNISVLLLKV